MMSLDPTSAEFFEQKYRANQDPWKFQTSPYELGRYRTILQALDGQHFRHAFEPGCSIGVLTEQFAMLADRVDACDFAESAVSQARERCAHHKHVRIACAALTEDIPWEQYDLIVLSEIGYYFSPQAWGTLTDRMSCKSAPGTTIVAAHWLGHSADHLMGGDEVHEILARDPSLERISSQCMQEGVEGYRLDLWKRGVA